MIKSETSRRYVSDVTGNDISDSNWVRVRFSLNGKNYILDADSSETLIESLLTNARPTHQGRPSNGNGSTSDV